MTDLTLEAFGLADAYKALTEKPLPPSFAKYIKPTALEGDSEYGVLDGCVCKDGLAGALQTAPTPGPHLFQHFTREQLEEAFTLTGSRRMPNLPRPRPAMKRAADREREQAEAEAAATREAEAAEQRRRAKKAYLENYPVDERVRMGFMKTALGTLLGQMKARKWEGWPYTDGNPFLLKITRALCKVQGVPDYFTVVSQPMDLVRMEENLAKSKYKTFELFEEDVRLLVSNAQSYNHAGDPVYNMAGELLHDFLEWLPMAQHSFTYMLNAHKKKMIKEEELARQTMQRR